VGIGGCAVAGVEVEPAFWRGRRVLLTGHTGFKGGWLSLWLQALGADCVGLSIDVPTEPSLYRLARLDESMEWITADVRDFEAVRVAVERTRPEIVVHMAAQSLVRRSFVDPRETYETNVMGTVNVLEAVRAQGDVRVVVNVTSDKCYENREWEWGYREDEPMGGHDPYSNSKGCAELVTSAYRRSFFESGETRLASARAGNVIGGGDWGEDRLIPDLMRAVLAGETLRVRNPGAVRPWQHVLNPLSGYLLLAQVLWDAPSLAGGWNFGPGDDDAQRVSWIVERVAERWPGGVRSEPDPRPAPHEAQQLKLDSSRARARLGWRPRWDLATGIDAVVEWYSAYADSSDAREITLAQIERFLAARGA
jgi:CDP-glucose 4,6-dehydratase